MVIASPALTAFGRWVERHRVLIDTIVVVALFAYDAMYLGVLRHGTEQLSTSGFVTALVLSATLCLLYTLRRRAPRSVLVVTAVVVWGFVVLGVGLTPAPLVVLGLMVYFVSARFGWRLAVTTAAIAALWVGVAALPLVRNEYLRIGEVGVLVLSAVFIAVVGVFTRARRAHVERLGELNDQLARQWDAQATIAAAEERARIAREIHDIVAHGLGTMVVMADGAVRTVGTDPDQAGEAMVRVRDTGRTAMTEMRRMLDVLRDDDTVQRAPQPGLDQCDRLLEEARATGLRVDFTVTGTPVALPAGVDLAAYRILQEAMTNARKHGGPLLSVVTVELAYQDTAISIRITDDGDCADAGTAADPATPGHGLVGMRERVSAYGGTLETGRRSGGGFEVHAVLPIGGTHP